MAALCSEADFLQLGLLRIEGILDIYLDFGTKPAGLCSIAEMQSKYISKHSNDPKHDCKSRKEQTQKKKKKKISVLERPKSYQKPVERNLWKRAMHRRSPQICL